MSGQEVLIRVGCYLIVGATMSWVWLNEDTEANPYCNNYTYGTIDLVAMCFLTTIFWPLGLLVDLVVWIKEKSKKTS